ncbi:hypothetical protein Tco_0278196 [Tanacetum coccineum]
MSDPESYNFTEGKVTTDGEPRIMLGSDDLKVGEDHIDDKLKEKAPKEPKSLDQLHQINNTIGSDTSLRERLSRNKEIVSVTALLVDRQCILPVGLMQCVDDIFIRASRLKKVMADKGKKSSVETFTPNDKANYYFRITSITVKGKNAYELKGKFLDDLHNNSFSGTNGKDAVEHIEYYLKNIDPIKLPNVDHDKLRIVVFSISLAGGARRWFDKTKESITCWVDLTANSFRKYYPPSCIDGINTPIIIWDPTNPKFEGWLAIKFVNYKTMDIFTKGALWDYWKMDGDAIKASDDESSDLEEYWSDKEETAKFFKI